MKGCEILTKTLAGRCAALLPFSRAELERQSVREPETPQAIFANRTTQLHLWQTLHTGFYSRIHDRQIPPIYFWRDRSGREVDLLLKLGQHLFLVEIKSGQTIGSDAFDNLTWWCHTADQSLADATLIYGGDQSYVRNEITVLPWFAV